VSSKKLVFLLTHSSSGGAQEIWANLAEGLQQKGMKATLMALYPHETTFQAAPETLTWKYLVPERPKGMVASLKLIPKFITYLKTEKPDLVFSAMPATNVLAPLAVWLAGSKTKVIPSHHAPVDTYNPYLNWLDGLTGSLKPTVATVCVSNSVAKSLKSKPKTYLKKVLTIHNALPPRIEKHLSELLKGRELKRTKGRLVVASGRLAAQKNYPQLLRAAVYMPDVNIKIIGEGPDRVPLEAMAINLGISDRVTFLGHMPREDALKVLSQADLFTQPSLFEGHSLALIEAAKLELPLVVSDAPVQIEGITLNNGQLAGISVGITDDEGLAKAITGILDDRASYSLWQNQARILGREATTERMMAAYESLVARVLKD
jgi:glycosyltransferase involved in cell wall biosynthesis